MTSLGSFEELFTAVVAPITNGTYNGATKRVKAEWKNVNNQEAAKLYKAELKKQYDKIHILGQQKPQPLQKLYTDVYLHDRPTHNYLLAIEELEKLHQEHRRFGLGRSQSDPMDGLAFAKQTKRLFILGKPGAGKTTFMKHLVMQALQSQIQAIPIFINLNEFSTDTDSPTILQFMAKQFEVCSFPDAAIYIEQLLTKGCGLILFDGLDEVSRENDGREMITTELSNFIKKYDGNRFAITCRIAASDYKFEGFDEVEMADFNDEQVVNFVSSWFSRSSRKKERFLEALNKPEHKGVKEMTSSPLLLALLCIQFDDSNEFLTTRSEIYDDALNVLFKRWDSSRDINRDDLILENENRYRALTPHRKMSLMSRIAYHSFEKGEIFIKQQWLEERIIQYLSKVPQAPSANAIEGEFVLKGIQSQHGILVERAMRVFSFSHLTLQEYFAAKYVVSHRETEIPKLIVEERLTDPRWREVFLFVAELLEEGDALVQSMSNSLHQMANKGEVKALVAWAGKRSTQRPFAVRQMASRVGYLTRARASARALDLVSTSTLARDLDLARASARALDLARGSVLARNLDLARASARASARALDQFVESMQTAVEESGRLEWKDLTAALQAVPPLSKDSIEDEVRFVIKCLQTIEAEIILDNWQWETDSIDDIELLTKWLEGHELLFECLDRVILDELNRETFEDTMLYCLSADDSIRTMDLD